ncbi:hypothetical protein L5F33_10040 [Aliarcobacter butzleri]|uniref:hypothetical protein n=1 Tax=Aliarcobacter butzleri TaxID=28197 RepID=UPI001EDD22A9|nr:hypothetical protein [Aliarcobacter butzleri]MCG3670606.1 hypothetical protein [Aliarcobacter butzleri]
MGKIVLDEKEVNELMETFDWQKSVYLKELKKVTSVISQLNQIKYDQEELNKKIILNGMAQNSVSTKAEKILDKLQIINSIQKNLEEIEKNSEQLVKNHLSRITANEFIEPMRLKIETEQFFFNSLLTENKQLIKTKIDEINEKIAEYLEKVQEQVEEIQIAKDVLDIRYENYSEKLGLYGEIFLENFQKIEEKIEVNRDKNLKLILYVTSGISITTLIVCGAILFKLFKLFH